MEKIKVLNRSIGNSGYSLPELNIRRVFTPGEVKELTVEELNALYQTDGGATIIKEYLFVQDEDWVDSRWTAEPEYFWTKEDMENCINKDSTELFTETLMNAPDGVIEILKDMAWKKPLSDLNKVDAMVRILGFNPVEAHKAMKQDAPREKASGDRKRTRKREAK